MYSHFNGGVSCPAYVFGLNVCLLTGADCTKGNKWDATNLVRASFYWHSKFNERREPHSIS
jgi:hypothetical protein